MKHRRNDKEIGTLYMQIDDIRKRVPTTAGFTPVVATTSRGGIDFRFYEKIGSDKAVILVSGNGGWDTPGRGELYPRLSEDLPRNGISTLHIKYRYPSILAEAVLDVLAGILFLEREGVRKIGIVGHSFGGAVAVQAAALSDKVVTIVPLATQSYGAHVAADIKGDVTALFMHGIDDIVLPVQSSVAVHGLIKGKKELVFLNGTGHGLEEAIGEVYKTVRDWLVTHLNGLDSPQQN